MEKTFSQMGLKEDLVSALPTMGIKMPLPVQTAAIPTLLKGRDLLLQARTGTGKTLAFLIPALQKIDIKKPYPQALIVTPTRELAVQVAGDAHKLGGGARVLNIMGGHDFNDEKNKLANPPHLIVGTPGRLLDHLRKKSINFGGINFFVLDEVDEMLQRGFLEEIAELSLLIGENRQTVVCSATLPQEVANIAKKIMRAPKILNIDTDKLDTVHIEHYLVKVSEEKRRWALAEILKRANPYLAIVFCASKESALATGEWLEEEGFSSGILQGDLSQQKRLKVLRDFRKARLQILVATDLAARGLDVEGVSHIINFALPPDRQQYIHRVGRTGRAGADGIAITLYTPEEARKVTALEQKLGFRFRMRNVAGDEIARPVKKTTAKNAGKAGYQHKLKR